jgi:Meckel syndrome type 1 protein
MFDLTLSTSLTSPLAIGAPGLAPAAGDFALALADLAMPGATASGPTPPLPARRQPPADSGNGLPAAAVPAIDSALDWLVVPVSGDDPVVTQDLGNHTASRGAAAEGPAAPLETADDIALPQAPGQSVERSSTIASADAPIRQAPRSLSGQAVATAPAGTNDAVPASATISLPTVADAAVPSTPDRAAKDDGTRKKKAVDPIAPIPVVPIAIPPAPAIAVDQSVPAAAPVTAAVDMPAAEVSANRSAVEGAAGNAPATGTAPPMASLSSIRTTVDSAAAPAIAAPASAVPASKAGRANAPAPTNAAPSPVSTSIGTPSIAPARLDPVTAPAMTGQAAPAMASPHGNAAIHADGPALEAAQQSATVVPQPVPASSTPSASSGPQAAGIVFGFALSTGLLPARRVDATDPSPREAALQALSAVAGSAQVAGAVLAAGTAQQATLDMRRDDWPQAMIDRIEALRDAADATSTRITLIPDALGKVDVALRHDGDAVHVHFTAEAAQTRALLADAQPRLAEAAQARGLRLGQATVDAGSGGAGRQPSQQPASANPLPSRPAPVTIAGDDAASDSSRLA